MLEDLKARARALKQEAYVLWAAYQDPRTPWYAKALAMAVVAYAFSPIDLIPDFIPVLGLLDDLVLVPLGIALVLKLVPEEVRADCRAAAEARRLAGKPTSRVAGAAIVVVWLLGMVGIANLAYRHLVEGP